MIKTIEEINELIKEKFEAILFSQISENAIAQIFIDTNNFIKPRKILIDDIKIIDNACKIEYYIDEKHYTMIVDKKEK